MPHFLDEIAINLKEELQVELRCPVFTKVFHAVHHWLVVQELIGLGISREFYHWANDFLSS